MTKKSSTPAIRFKGFTDTWEQRKLGEIGSVSMCRRIFKEQTSETGDIPFYKIGTFGADPDAFISRELFEEYKSKYPYPQKGDILISASGSIGRTVEFAGNNEYFQDSNIVWLNHDERLSNPFLKCFYSVVKWAGIEGSTIKRLYNDNILNTVICMPSVPEQKRIGLFFENLDNLITLHQRKYDKLTNVKKSMLEKMFPKNGSNVPEIRFKGFTEAWEQRELWELTIWDKKFNEVEAEKQPKIIKYPYVLADVFSKIEDASGDVRLLSTGNYIGYTTDEKAGKNLCVGEVVAIPWGGVPNIKYYKGKFVTADNRIATSNDTETLGNRFLSLYLEHSLAFLQSIYRGASIKHPSMNDVLSMQISIPHIQEQREIETWFANLDNLITLHQRELEKLKNLKKACLEKMFV